MRASESNRKTRQSRTAEMNVYADVYWILLGGMLISTGLFVLGIVRALMRPQYVPLTRAWIKQHYHWQALVSGIVALDPTTLMLLATVLLILTPVARVAVSIYAFAVDGDRKFVVVTSIVLFMIVVAVVLGLLGVESPR